MFSPNLHFAFAAMPHAFSFASSVSGSLVLKIRRSDADLTDRQILLSTT